MDSILTSIKQHLGITEDYEHFDADIINHINSVFTILMQIGVGPENGFKITDKSQVWSDFMPDDERLEFVKTYIEKRVKLMFDPPQSSAVIDVINRQIEELEWRLYVEKY